MLTYRGDSGIPRGSRREIITVNASTKRHFSRQVATLREQHELTQNELGRKVGVSGTCVWNWEGANTFPRPATLRRLAEALGTNVADLVGHPVESASDIETSGREPKSLAEIIVEARRSVASAAGVPLSKVRVVLDCGD
jgi:transcriptional regulator with XRE-family HTH domain